MYTCYGMCVCLITCFAALMLTKCVNMIYNSTVSDVVLTGVNLFDAAKVAEDCAVWPL